MLLLIVRRKKINKGWTYVVLTCIFELLWIYGFNAAESWPHFILIALIIVADFYFLEKACETIQTVAEKLNAEGKKVGLLAVHLYRPFSVKHFMAAIPETVKRIFIDLLIAWVFSLNLSDNLETPAEKE